MKVSELYDSLDYLLGEHPYAEDFDVYFIIGNRQFNVTSLLDGIQMGEYEDGLRVEKYGEAANYMDVSLEHLSKIWLVSEEPAEKLDKTVKKFRDN